MKTTLIIAGVAIVGEFLAALLVGRILHFFSELDEAIASSLIPCLPRDSGKGLPREMPLKTDNIGYSDDHAA